MKKSKQQRHGRVATVCLHGQNHYVTADRGRLSDPESEHRQSASLSSSSSRADHLRVEYRGLAER